MKLDFHQPSEDLCRVVNLVRAALFTLDGRGRIAGWSDGAERITGYKADEVMGLLKDGKIPVSLRFSRLLIIVDFSLD